MAKKPQHFKPPVSAEAQFSRALKRVGRASGHLVELHVHGHKIDDEREMQASLKAYSEKIGPWARRQSAKMLEQVSKANKRAYTKKSKLIGRLLNAHLLESGQGTEAFALMNEQVALIKSIPLRAGERAQALAAEALVNGSRASEVAEELMRSSKVSESNALRIARTEVARSNAALTEVRALNAGSQGYIWRTTMDGAERDSHAKMNGKFVLYKNPPTLSDGTTGHAGTFPNCRCYQDVQFDDEA